jgi:beta-lactamase regulating signal transducer with metallopeptidase domain
MTAAPSVGDAAVLGLVLRATLLIGAAWAAAAMLRKARASAAARHLAWLLGTAALLALPFIWWLAPPLRLPILGPEEAETAAALFVPPAGASAPATAGTPGWGNILLALWLIGVAALLLRFALSRRLVSRLWRDAEPAREAAWQGLLASAAREMRLSRPVALRIARGPALPMIWGPMTWGTLTPRILLPAEAGSWPQDRRRLVLLHELAHVARRDSLSLSAASLACAFYWFHPGAWFAARRMRLEQEYAADDRVLKAGAPARSYARSLLDLAPRVGERAWPDHASAMAGTCQLERRVLSITTPAPREQPGLPFLSASVAIATCVMLAVATGLPVRPLPPLPDPLETETAFPDTGAMPVPAEGGSGQDARMAGRVTIARSAGDRPRDIRNGFDAPQAAAPAPAEGRAREMAGQPIEPAAQNQTAAPVPGAVINPERQDAIAPRQLASYGPQLPQPLPAEQETDPRIPAALRGGNAGREGHQRARPASSRSRTNQVLAILPRMILEASGVLPPG